MSVHTTRGRPRLIPTEAASITVKVFPKELAHVDRCASYRVHDKVRAATLRDLLKSARLSFPVLAKLIVLSQRARHIIEVSSMEAVSLSSEKPYLTALGCEDTADVLRMLDTLGSTFEDIFRLTVVGTGGDPRDHGETDAELSDPLVRQKECVAFDRALRDALDDPG
jgi:hypothetical protein